MNIEIHALEQRVESNGRLRFDILASIYPDEVDMKNLFSPQTKIQSEEDVEELIERFKDFLTINTPSGVIIKQTNAIKEILISLIGYDKVKDIVIEVNPSLVCD